MAYILFGGETTSSAAGLGNAALFYVLYTFRNAFGYFKNGYASAMAWACKSINPQVQPRTTARNCGIVFLQAPWVLFVVIFLLMLILFRKQKRWVFYEVEGEE